MKHTFKRYLEAIDERATRLNYFIDRHFWMTILVVEGFAVSVWTLTLLITLYLKH